MGRRNICNDTQHVILGVCAQFSVCILPNNLITETRKKEHM